MPADGGAAVQRADAAGELPAALAELRPGDGGQGRDGDGEHQPGHRQGDADLDQRHSAVAPRAHPDRYFPAVEGPAVSPPWTEMSSPPPCALFGPKE